MQITLKKFKNQHKVISPENTLIVVNVHGFHKRGEASKDKKRSIIWIHIDITPGPSKSIPADLYNGSLF